MLILPKDFPINTTLRDEGVPLSETCPAGRHPLRILFLNLMPKKVVTELDMARVLSHPDVDVQLIPMKIAGQTYKNTPMEHMQRFYEDFDRLEHDDFDGMIVTGAPVEHFAFEEVRYWPQLCHIMDWARRHVRSVLYVCWGAQAGLYHNYGIPKYALPAKCFGVFWQQADAGCPLFDGIGTDFPMPNSRHTEVRRDDFVKDGRLEIVAESSESGIGVVWDGTGREVYIVGHLEYAPQTLHEEYLRDAAKGLAIAPPLHYYKNDDVRAGVNDSWRTAARCFYRNWLKLCQS